MNRHFFRKVPLPPVLGFSLWFAGCATQRTEMPAPPPPVAIGVRSRTAPEPDLPGGSAIPEAVYRNPKIAMVTLRAHVDAEGRLLGPQVMYQVAEPGGWNIDAVENGRGLIPASNAQAAPNSEAPLLDPDRAGRIAITGLMRAEDRAEAEARARDGGPGTAAVFDRDAGWLLVPGR